MAGDEPYWLVMMQPRAVTIDIHFGKNSESPDYRFTLITVLLIFSTYFVALLLFVKVYSKRAARRVTDSLENVLSLTEGLAIAEIVNGSVADRNRDEDNRDNTGSFFVAVIC